MECEQGFSDLTSDGLVRNRALRLFTYLKELTELRGEVKRNCDDYDQVIWWAEIPREKECYCAAWDVGGEPAYEDWLRVERPRRKRPPPPPPALLPWLNERDVSDASQDAPPLKDSIIEELAGNRTEGANRKPWFEGLKNALPYSVSGNSTWRITGGPGLLKSAGYSPSNRFTTSFLPLTKTRND